MTCTWSRNISDLFAGNIPTVHEGKIKNMKNKIQKWKNVKGWFLAAKKQHMVTIAAKIVTVIDTE